VARLIPFNVPYVPETSKQYVLEALESNHQQGDGPFTAQASKFISNMVGGGHVLLTPSCTHALEMASMLANLGPGDEVILPSYTFTSAATAVTKFGATPVFVDIELVSKGIDVNQVREAITPKTKAISWVNYAGVAPDIEGLQRLAKEFDLLLIEDNAHGLGGSYRGKPLGSFGDFATQSFHATKNIQCGEGGALVINNSHFTERAEIIREKGTNRSKFIRGEIKKYQWVDQGSSYLLAESLAAILLGSLEEFKMIQVRREMVSNTYRDKLNDWAMGVNYDLEPQVISEINSAHMFYMVSESQESRDSLIRHLKKYGIQSMFHYQSLADSKQGRVFRRMNSVSINSQKMSNLLLRLPIYPSMSSEDLELIVNKVLDFHA
jgi:dTDP-4-amino-4,6-dideoxygalactose transaminase